MTAPTMLARLMSVIEVGVAEGRCSEEIARGVLKEQRVPTEAMERAARATGDHWYFDESWAAMIDAALAEPTQDSRAA